MSTRFPPYPAYKPSGVPWLGAIPAHWEVVRLKYAAPFSFDRFDEKPDDLPYIGLENIESKTGRLLLDAPIEVVESAVNRFDAGDVLFGKLRPYLAKVALPNFRGVCTTEILALQPTSEMDARFLFYKLLSDGLINLIDSFTFGSKMPRASSEQIGNTKIGLPPLPEQRSIAAFLDRETARLDTLIAKKQQLIQRLQEKRTALISRAVTKGLDANARMKDSGVAWLGEVPEHWEVRRLKFTIDRCQNGLWGDEPNGTPDDIICIRVADFDRVTSRVRDTEFTLRAIPISQRRGRELQAGDLLLEKSGGGELQPVGKVVLYDLPYNAICSNFIARMRPLENYDSRFLNYLFDAAYSGQLNVKSLKQNTGIQNLDSDSYLSECGAFPSLPEQRAIAAYLDRETARLDALAAKIQDAIERLREYRGALIAAAVTGKIDVRDTAYASRVRA